MSHITKHHTINRTVTYLLIWLYHRRAIIPSLLIAGIKGNFYTEYL
jgi:hypothetical protein